MPVTMVLLLYGPFHVLGKETQFHKNKRQTT